MIANVRALTFFLAGAVLGGYLGTFIGLWLGYDDAGRFGFAIGGALALWYGYRRWLRQ